MRTLLVFLLLLKVKILSWIFYRMELEWLDEPPEDVWRDIRLVALLNHTSLFEPVYAAGVPLRFLWQLAARGVVPAAAKTMNRPFAGLFYRLVGRQVISITRERDATWDRVLAAVGEDSMVVILPEGRMKRADGLDSRGEPMTVRGGIADLLEVLPDGRFLLAYSGGLHHVQAPGEGFPRLFRTIRLKVEVLTVAGYRDRMRAAAADGDFKAAVVADLEGRRDRICGPMEASLMTGRSRVTARADR